MALGPVTLFFMKNAIAISRNKLYKNRYISKGRRRRAALGSKGTLKKNRASRGLEVNLICRDASRGIAESATKKVGAICFNSHIPRVLCERETDAGVFGKSEKEQRIWDCCFIRGDRKYNPVYYVGLRPTGRAFTLTLCYSQLKTSLKMELEKKNHRTLTIMNTLYDKSWCDFS